MLDLVGYSTVPEDASVAQTRLDQFFGWVLSLPWWTVWGFVLVATLWLMWVSWPRQQTPREDSPNPQTDAQPASDNSSPADGQQPAGIDLGGIPEALRVKYAAVFEEIDQYRSANLMPIGELWREAQRKGWRQASAHDDFCDAIVDAGFRGTLQVWGRSAVNVVGTPSPRGQLERIPKYVWDGAAIGAPMMAALGGNFGPITAVVPKHGHPTQGGDAMDTVGFVDMHMARDAALKWLDEEAFQFKGRASAANRMGRGSGRR